jgi:integrase
VRPAGGQANTPKEGVDMTEPTTAEVTKKPKQKPSELAQPGDATAWKEGRRHRMVKSGKIVVDARDWSVLLGQQVTATHDNVIDAKRRQSDQRRGRYHGQEFDPGRGKLAFAAIAAEWLVSNPAKQNSSRDADLNRLVGSGVRLRIEGEGKEMVALITEKPTDFAAMAVGRITSADVQRLVDAWRTSHKASSVAGMYSSLRAVFHYAEKSRAIPKRSSPCEDIDLPPVREEERPVLLPDDADLDEFVGVRTLSNDDLIRLATELGPDYGLMVWIAVYTGMRWSEIAGLTVSSLNVVLGEIKVVHALERKTRSLKEPKSLAGTRFFVDRDLAPDIAAHLAHRGLTAADGEAPVFVNNRGRALSYSSRRTSVWVPALHRAGLARKKTNGQYLGLHDLRSMNSSIMNDQGVDNKTAQFRRGHANGQSGDRMGDLYTRTSPRRNLTTAVWMGYAA